MVGVLNPIEFLISYGIVFKDNLEKYIKSYSETIKVIHFIEAVNIAVKNKLELKSKLEKETMHQIKDIKITNLTRYF